MKKYTLYLVLFFGVFLSFCSKKEATEPPLPTGTSTSSIKLSNATIFADGFDETAITVLDKNGNDVTPQAIVKINGVTVTNLKYSSTTPGTVSVTATIGADVLPTVTITAVNAGVSKYSAKVLLEKYTAAWCGFCPRVSYKVKQTTIINNKIIPVYIHDGDALNFPLVSQLKNLFSISAVPGVVLNRKTGWSDNQNDWNEMVEPAKTLTTAWAAVGQSIQSNLNGSVLSGKVQTEFNINTSRPLKIIIMLVEDGIVLSQSNYYNTTSGPLMGLGQPITGYVQQNVLRQIATDILGDAIPASATVKNNIYEKSFSFNISGYNSSKCFIVSAVVYDNSSIWQGAINSQIVKAGQTQNFD